MFIHLPNATPIWLDLSYIYSQLQHYPKLFPELCDWSLQIIV